MDSASHRGGESRAPIQPNCGNFYSHADFFALRSALPVPSSGEPQEIVFLRAATLSAFAQPEASSRMLVRLLDRPVANAALEIQARELLMLNRRAVFRYQDALDAVAPVLRGAQDERVRGIENRARLLRAIADVGPQSVTPGNHAPLFPDEHGRIAVSVGHRTVPMFVDTGANLSVMRSTSRRRWAWRSGPRNYAVGSSVGGRVKGRCRRRRSCLRGWDACPQCDLPDLAG